MKNLLKFGFILTILFMATQGAYAQEGNIASINVYPVTKTVTISKGEAEQGKFKVQNVSEAPQHISVSPRHWHMVDENMAIPLDSWLKIDPLEFDIGPGEEKEIAYDINVPQEAKGELAAMIAFRPERKPGQSVNVVFSVSLYVRVKEEEKAANIYISNFKLWKFTDRKAIGVKMAFKNDGNIHLKPRTQVYIKNLFNKVLNTAPLKYGKPVYPGKVQSYSGAVYNFELKPGIYTAMIDTELASVAQRFRKNVYFLVGKNGEIIFTFFKEAK